MVERKFGLGVVVCVFNQDFSKVFLLKRSKEKRNKGGKDWGNPGGSRGERSQDNSKAVVCYANYENARWEDTG